MIKPIWRRTDHIFGRINCISFKYVACEVLTVMGVEHTKVKMVEKSGDKVTSAVDGLPIEIMRLILTYVPSRDLLLNCSRVCKQWRELVSDDVLWRRRCESASVMCPTQCTDESSLFTDYSFYQRLCVFRPFDRNLVKNWNAAGQVVIFRTAVPNHLLLQYV